MNKIHAECAKGNIVELYNDRGYFYLQYEYNNGVLYRRDNKHGGLLSSLRRDERNDKPIYGTKTAKIISKYTGLYKIY